MDPEVATGANIYIKGTDPRLLPDDKYPEWLWGLLEKPKTIKQLNAVVQEMGYYDMPPQDFFRLARLKRKMKIKAANLASKKR
jgi:large subunit ribosomal protein L54